MNSTQKTATGGKRKAVTLLVLGDNSTYLHPLFLHARAGHIVGFAVPDCAPPIRFRIPISEFHKTQINVVKA